MGAHSLASSAYLAFSMSRRTLEQAEWIQLLAPLSSDDAYHKLRSANVTGDRSVMLAAVEVEPLYLQCASLDLQGDRDFVLAAIMSVQPGNPVGVLLKFASDSVRADRELILLAVERDGRALQHASVDVQIDHEVILSALAHAMQAPDVACMVGEAFKKCRAQIVRKIVEAHGLMLAYVTETLQGDFEAVLQNGFALQFAAPALRADFPVVSSAVQRHGGALQFASADLRANRDIVLSAVVQHGDALQYASDDLKFDRELVLAAVNSWGLALQHASESLRSDYEVATRAVTKDGNALQYVSGELAANKKLATTAISQCHHAIRFVDQSLSDDDDLTNLVFEGMRESARRKL
eukprot:TRINITY_DN11560_c0_g1_i1.p1 TRINITY_DN11560_c0_g1~~TRINITY_DN11560_c0_g1_i1.p1  ORF type:complete len:389 (-),score=52.09 TRINITY_DN11560_c0_g1_i1:563-1615(-)